MDHSYLHFDMLTCLNLSWSPSGKCSQYMRWQINCHLVSCCSGMFGILDVMILRQFLTLTYFFNLVSVDSCSWLFHRYQLFVVSMFIVNNLMHCCWFWWTTYNQKKDDTHLSRHVLPYINKAVDRKSQIFLDNNCKVFFKQGNVINTFMITKNVFPYYLATSRLSSHTFPSFECHPVSVQVSCCEPLSDSVTTTYFATRKPSNKTE